MSDKLLKHFHEGSKIKLQVYFRGLSMPTNEGYFDTKRDIEIINAVGFFCQACLVDKPASEISPDSRYCWFCYEFLLKEAEMDASRRGGDWKPQEADTMPAQVSQDVRTIMSTVKSKKLKWT